MEETITDGGSSYSNTYISGSARVIQGNYIAVQQANQTEQDGLRLSQVPLSNPLDDLSHLRKLKTAASGTCAWVFETQQFVQWKEIQPPALFWITGGPGMGKTVLSTFLVDNVLDQLQSYNRSDTKAKLAYFFCDNSNKKRCSALAILRGLLYQLCRADHDLMKNHMQREYAAQINPSEGMLENFDALWRVFESILGDPRTGEVIVIIDALDECDSKSQATFLEHLMRILSRRGRTGAAALKVIVTSRHSKTIGPYMSGRAHHLHVDSRRIAGDLEAFISGKVRQLSETNHYPEDLRQEVERKLLLNHGGTFLWVYLAVSQLEDVRTPNVLEYLDQFPTDIFDVYDRILERIPHKYREDARFVFRVVAAAERPLTKIEVCRAFSISSKKSWSSAWANPEPSETYSRDRLQMQIFDYCSDFVHFEKQGDTESLHLIHYSAKEYLLNDAVNGLAIVAALWLIPCFIVAVPIIYFRVYLTYYFKRIRLGAILLLASFSFILVCIIAFLCFVLSQLRINTMGSMLNFCFPVIAILPLPRKTRLFYQVDPPAANYLLFRISFRTLWSHYSPETDLLGPISPVLLDYATDALHKHAIRSVNDVTDIFPWNPSILKSAPFIRNLWLKLAAREPDSRINTSLMRMLLKNGADTESSIPIADEVDSELTPLSVAARHGNIAAVKLLVKWGADLEHRSNRWGWTALRFAARTTVRAENNEVLKFLIEQKADVDAVDRNQETTLVSLVDRSASMNKKDRREPGKELVDYLRVVRHNILDVFQWTTDSDSTMHDTIKLIAEHSRNLNATDGNGRTALTLAAKSRQWTIVELLLNCNADVDIEDERGMTPLLWALQAPKRPAQHRDMIIGENSRTFIGQVVYRKYQENETVDPAEEAYGRCIEMLIRKSGKIEAQDRSGRTALSKAAEIANYDIVKMLLEKGADVNSSDRRGMTPLMWASRRREVCSAVFRDIHVLDNSVAFIGNILILEDPVAEEGPRFELGSYHREERNETIHLLLEHGADLEAADKKGKTALDFALQDELDDAAAFLSSKGAMFSPEHVHRRAERGEAEVEGKGKGKGQATNSTVDTNWLELSQVSRRSFVPKRRFEIIATKDNGRAAIPEDDTTFDRNLGDLGSFRTQEKTLETFPRCLFRHLEISGEAEFISRIEPPASWIPTRALRAEYLASFPTCAYKNIWAHGNSDVQCGNLLVICRKRNDMEFAISSQMVGNRFSDIYVTDTSTFRCDLFTADRVQDFAAEVLASVWKTLELNDR